MVYSPQVVEGRFSQRVGVALKIQYVVNQLKREPNPFPVLESHVLDLMMGTVRSSTASNGKEERH